MLSPVKKSLLRLAMNIECVSSVLQEVLKRDLETLITDRQFQNFQRNEIRGISISKVLQRMVLRRIWKVLHHTHMVNGHTPNGRSYTVCGKM